MISAISYEMSTLRDWLSLRGQGRKEWLAYCVMSNSGPACWEAPLFNLGFKDTNPFLTPDILG